MQRSNSSLWLWLVLYCDHRPVTKMKIHITAHDGYVVVYAPHVLRRLQAMNPKTLIGGEGANVVEP